MIGATVDQLFAIALPASTRSVADPHSKFERTDFFDVFADQTLNDAGKT